MAKEKKEMSCKDQESAFEMIELAVDDLQTLTKAFNMINKVCQELDGKTSDDETSTESSALILH